MKLLIAFFIVLIFCSCNKQGGGEGQAAPEVANKNKTHHGGGNDHSHEQEEEENVEGSTEGIYASKRYRINFDNETAQIRTCVIGTSFCAAYVVCHYKINLYENEIIMDFHYKDLASSMNLPQSYDDFGIECEENIEATIVKMPNSQLGIGNDILVKL